MLLAFWVEEAAPGEILSSEESTILRGVDKSSRGREVQKLGQAERLIVILIGRYVLREIHRLIIYVVETSFVPYYVDTFTV